MAVTGRGRTTNTAQGGGTPPGQIGGAAGATRNKAKLRRRSSRQRLGGGNGAVTQHFSITRASDGASVNAEQFVSGMVGWFKLNGIVNTEAQARKAYAIGMQHVNTLIGTTTL